MLLSAPAAFLSAMSTDAMGGEPETSVPEANIAFHSDAELAVLSGSGTANDPYIIENRILDSRLGDGRSAIFIEHTTKHLLIRNCTVYGATTGDVSGRPSQITLSDVRNVTIKDCTISGAASSSFITGVLIKSGQDIDISNCTIGSNNRGMWLDSAQNVTISDCDFIDSRYAGVYSYLSSFVTLRRCTFQAVDGAHATYLDECDNYTVAECSFDEIPYYVVVLNSINVTYRSCHGSDSARGYDISACADLTLENNILENITGQAVRIVNSNGVKLHGNVINNFTSTDWYSAPVMLQQSSGIEVIGNRIDRSASHGMHLNGIVDAVLDHNSITNTTSYGIYAKQLSYVVMSNNTVAHTDLMGISDLNASSNITIENNHFHHIASSALNIWDANDVMVMGNHFEHIIRGFFLSGGRNITVTHNLFRDYTSSPFGSQLEGGYSVFLNAFVGGGFGSPYLSRSDGIRFDDGTYGNYWSWMTLADEDRDGIADEPVIIPAFSVLLRDMHPLMGWAAPVTGLAADNSSNDIVVSWNGPNYTIASGVEYYILYRDGAEPRTWQVEGTSFTDSTADFGVPYSYKVMACTAWGDGPYGEPVTTVLESTPELTIDAPAQDGIVTTSTVSASWSATDNLGIAHYEYSIDGGQWQETNDTQVEIGPLSEGAHTLTVKAFNTIGRYDEETVSFRVDAESPVVTILAPGDGNAYATTSVHLSFTADDDGTSVNTGSMAYRWGDGPLIPITGFEAELGPLSPGEHVLTLVVEDASGNVGTATVTFVIDTTAPLLDIVDPEEGEIVSTASLVLSWQASDPGSWITRTESSVDGGDWVDHGEAISAMVSLSDGPHNIKVRTWNGAGLSTMREVNVTVDTTAPELAIAFPVSGGAYNTSTLEAKWSGNDAGTGLDHYEYRLDGGQWSAPTTATSYLLEGLSDGSHTFYVRAWDDASNSWTVAVTFIIDTAGPTITIVPAEGGLIDSPTVDVFVTTLESLSGIESYTYWMDGEEVSSSASDHRFTGLADGVHHLVVLVRDNAGNTIRAYANFTVDTVAPVLTISSPGNGTLTNRSWAVVSWMCTDANLATLQMSIDGGPWVQIDTDATSAVVEDLEDGEHTFVVRAEDLGGNSVSASVTFRVDTVAPSITGSPTGNEVEIGSSIVIRFSEAMNKTSVRVLLNGAEASLSWEGFNATLSTTDLRPGTDYTVQVTGADLAGNEGTHSWTFTATDMGTLTGKVVDASGQPIAGAEVALDSGETTVTGEDGTFSLSARMGEHEVTVAKDGYVLSTTTATVEGGATADMGTVVLSAAPGGTDLTLMVLLAVLLTAALVGGLYLLRQRKA